jgi:hypothetical protein
MRQPTFRLLSSSCQIFVTALPASEIAQLNTFGYPQLFIDIFPVCHGRRLEVLHRLRLLIYHQRIQALSPQLVQLPDYESE